MRKVLLLLCVLAIGLSACAPGPTMYVTGGTRYVDLTGAAIGDAIANSHVQHTDINLGILPVKPLPLDADKFVYRDSAAADILSTSTGTQLKAYLKTYFDTVYGLIGATHTQNTDWTLLDSAGGANLVNNGVLVGDLRTDRWLSSDTNTFLGVDVIGAENLDHTALIEGYENTAIGNEAGYALTIGYSNTLIGNNAGDSITIGYNNTAIGSDSAQAITTANSNVALGDQSLMNNTGDANTAIGKGAMGNVGTGGYNVAVGALTMNSNTGEKNTAVGASAGNDNTGDNCVFVGYRAGDDNINDNALYIDNSETATPLIYGDFSTDDVVINGNAQVTGDLYFPTVGGGLPYGCIYSNTLNDITCTVQSAWYQIPFDNAGVSNLTTVSIANDDITILKTGNYQVTFNISRHTHFAHDYEYMIKTNNGTVDVVNAHIYCTSLGTNKLQSFSHTAITTFTANDTVEVWVRCTDAPGMVLGMDHVNMNVTMVGR